MAQWEKSGWVDLELDDEDQLETAMPIPMAEKPRYPYELRIALVNGTLDKVGLDCDCELDDFLEFKVRAIVTAISKTDGHRRVELQIVRMKIEDEPDGDDD